MYFAEQLTLRAVTRTAKGDGRFTETNTDTTIWGDHRSATRSEFYSAASSGFEITAMFQVHTEEYSGQKIVLYKSKTYHVVRAFDDGYGKTELTCSDKAAKIG